MKLNFFTEHNKYFKNITVVEFNDSSFTVYWKKKKDLIQEIKKEIKSKNDDKIRFIDLGDDIYSINPETKIKIYKY